MWNKGSLVPTIYRRTFNHGESVWDVKGKDSHYGPSKGTLVPTNYERKFNPDEGVGDVKGKYSIYRPSNET